MKDLNGDCNGNGRHLFYGENNVENRQCYTTSIQRTVSDAQTGHDKNGLKRKLLEHDAIFKNQVYDLHRLYRTQRDMMEYRKTKEGHIHGDSKARKKSIDLQLPADEYSDTEDAGRLENSVKLCNGDFFREKMDNNSRISIGLADLNEPAEIEEAGESSSIKIFGQFARSGAVPMQKPGHGRNNFNGSKWDRFSYEAGATSSKVVNQDHPPGFHLANHSQETTGKERMTCGLEGFHTSQEYANHTRNSQPSSSYQFLGSSVMSADSLSPKLTSFHSQNSSRCINKTLQENWYVNNSPHSNTGLTRNPPSFNGFYHASSSGSKDSPVFGFGTTIASSSLVYMDSSCIDKRKQKDFNLNETFPGNALNEDHKPGLPWLRAKQACNSETANSRKDVIFISSSPPPTGKDINGIWPKNERYKTESEKKILGVPICQRLGASENEASSLTYSASGRENAKREKKKFVIDINVACDDSLLESGDESEVEEVVVEKVRVKNFIDLNTCVTEDEDFPVLNGASSNTRKKFVADFDLEMPAVPEEEDNLPEKEKEQLDDEVLMSAAKAIVDISSSAGEFESLLLFAHVVVASTSECSYKMDDFEAMTLLLPDTKEEDFMPKLFVPELQVEEEGKGNVPPGRPRRGQARRGRHRRDFQRDILPGLATLSRHEMTEDLQTFGGLMKVTGHAWNSGLTKRSGGSRGRRPKAVEVGGCSQQVNNEENNSLEDKRSLTSWGKTTRRPRRQRCPASNPPVVALT